MSLNCFVAHVFSRKLIDDLRPALASAFSADFGPVRLRFADEDVGTGHILKKIQDEIDQASLCIFEMSEIAKPNVFLEFGYALAKEIPYLIVLENGKPLPADLQGYDHIQYDSFSDLTRKIRAQLPRLLSSAISRKHTAVAELQPAVLSFIQGVARTGDSVGIDALHSSALEKKIPASQVDNTVRGLLEAGYFIRSTGNEIRLTEKGMLVWDQLQEFARKV